MDFFNSLLKKLDKPKVEVAPAQGEWDKPTERDEPIGTEDERKLSPEAIDTETKDEPPVIRIDDLTTQMEYGKKLLATSSNPFDREYYRGVVATLEHLLQNLSFNQEILGNYLKYAEQSGSRAPGALDREYYKGVIATLRHLQEQTGRQPI